VASGTGSTEDRSYTERLTRLGGARWKQVLDVQAPYRWNLRRHLGGRTVLDVGCGIGRNLQHLDPSSVGVDHNQESVGLCRAAGLNALTADEMAASDELVPGRFDGLLAAHLLEHLPEGAASDVLRPYLRYLAPGARLVFICPQQRGFRSDATHTVYFDDELLARTMREIGADVVSQSSFPFPRAAGRWFTYNEFVTVGRLADPR
jgi:SAM-dependent methyltransferase